MRDPAFARSLGVPNATLEGYLYPDTYRFRAGTPPAKVLAQLVKHGQDVLAALEKQHPDGVTMLQEEVRRSAIARSCSWPRSWRRRPRSRRSGRASPACSSTA